MSTGEMLTLAALGLCILLYNTICRRLAAKNREAMLQDYARSHVNSDMVVCGNLRAGDWPEDRIKLWCNTNRCVYYSPEYNSTDL